MYVNVSKQSHKMSTLLGTIRSFDGRVETITEREGRKGSSPSVLLRLLGKMVNLRCSPVPVPPTAGEISWCPSPWRIDPIFLITWIHPMYVSH